MSCDRRARKAPAISPRIRNTSPSTPAILQGERREREEVRHRTVTVHTTLYCVLFFLGEKKNSSLLSELLSASLHTVAASSAQSMPLLHPARR
jgi:hypothetical protein